MQEFSNKDAGFEKQGQAVPPPWGYAPSLPWQGAPQEDEIDLLELIRVLWDGKWWIVLIGFLFSFMALVYALKMPNQYQAEVVLAPAMAEQKGGLSSRFGGLAAMAGIDMGSAGVDKTTIALEVAKSRDFITSFIRKHELLVPLFAAKKWDREKNGWILDEDVYDAEKKVWLREVDPPKTPEPSDWDAYKVFLAMLSVDQSKDSGIVRIGVTSLSPLYAKIWAETLVKELNLVMRQRDIEEAERSIVYLEKELQNTSVAQMQQVFYKLIEEQTQTKMLARVREEYVFKTIDPAVIPEEKIKPKRLLILIVGGMVGGMMGIFFVFARHAFRGMRSRWEETGEKRGKTPLGDES